MIADLDDMTDSQLRDLLLAVEKLLDDRTEVARAEQAVRAAIDAYTHAAGVTELQAWRALAPKGAGVPPDPEPEPVPEALPWAQPQAHNPYQLGDRVSFEGSVYESVQDTNVWSPAAYPMGWRKL